MRDNVIEVYSVKFYWLASALLSVVTVVLENIRSQFKAEDGPYIAVILLLLALDTFTGVYKSIKSRKFSSYKLGRTAEKFIVFMIACAGCVVLRSLQGSDVVHEMFDWAALMIYYVIIAREFFSIGENFQELGYKVMPKWVSDRFEQFTSTGQSESKND